MTDERTRTDWKGRYEAAQAERDQLRQDLDKANTTLENQQALIDEREHEVAELRKQVNLARIQGMNEVTGLLLREAHP
jgi:predicted  nucleic acid-binding Zn-ribbon protein